MFALKRRLKVLLHFFLGQGSIQLTNLLVGFCLLRWMSVTAYAQAGVALAFQSTVAMLIDLGFSGSIVALAGERGTDPAVVGRYLRSAKYFRTRMYFIVGSAAIGAFFWITARQPWDLGTKFLLLGSILAGIYFQGWNMYAAPLLIHRNLRLYYRPQMVSTGFRALACGLLYLAGSLSAWTASWVSTAAAALSGSLYRRASRPYLDEPRQSDHACNREVIKYLSPLIPGAAFTAFQGSISTALITIFGRTASIAEVAALGRLSQIFGVFGAFNSVVIAPYLARTPRSLLLRRYLSVAGGGVLLSAAICGLVFLLPGPFLWLLGPKYQHLRVEVGWIVAVACVDFLSSCLWSMNSSRKWLYWWGTIVYISLLLCTQALCVFAMDLSKTLHVIQFSLITSSVVLCIHVATACYGFRYGSALDEPS